VYHTQQWFAGFSGPEFLLGVSNLDTNAAGEISTADPIELNYLVSALHKKISNYLFICSLLLDTDRLDSNSSD
jgi:hypothetical protein